MFTRFILATTSVLFSISAFSAIELYSKIGNTQCLIANNKAVKTTSMLHGKVSLTTTKEVSFQGLEVTLSKAIASASGRASSEDMIWTATVDGVSTPLNYNDSFESLAIIKLMSSACN
jgi:ABC-type uncharacterized transport system ATPase subunit